MNILALEPYYGGSHKAFVDGWIGNSCHQWTLMTLPPHKWKWRMRHSAVTFAAEVAKYFADGQKWDMIFCSDMLNLAEFLGLVPAALRQLPTVAYFHENQLTYPVRFASERDYQFAMTNMTTALAATSVWFNSAFHRDSFIDALEKFLRKMPDCQPINVPSQIREKAVIYPQGINKITRPNRQRRPGPMRILWVARFEHDKNPEEFFEAVKVLKSKGIDFRLSVIGEQFRDQPKVFTWAKDYFTDNIENWGYQQSLPQYHSVLTDADLIVSTAEHEFFGISVVEAISAGSYPVVPNRLAYPEILGLGKNEGVEDFFYDGSVKALTAKLTELAEHIEKKTLWLDKPNPAEMINRLYWKNLAPTLDNALNDIKS
ncbi:DUF3524 domain-containing protein [Planctomycetota bacterium]